MTLPVLCLGLLALAPAADEPKPAAYPRPELLIEASELKRPETARQFRILDVRTPEKYRAGHIPRSSPVSAAQWNKAFTAGPDRKQWQDTLGRLGIDANTRVVVYGEDLREVARVWWILRYWGVKDARLLNGGWAAWQAAGGETARGEEKEPAFKPIDRPELKPQPGRLATRDNVLDLIKKGQEQIIDSRSPAEFSGDRKMAKRGGTIPGSVHLEWSDLIDRKTQRFKRAEELTKLFKEAGIDPDKPATTFCQSGGRAAVMAFGLELMGGKGVRNYYRSWAEWGNQDDTPVVTPKPKK